MNPKVKGIKSFVSEDGTYARPSADYTEVEFEDGTVVEVREGFDPVTALGWRWNHGEGAVYGKAAVDFVLRHSAA